MYEGYYSIQDFIFALTIPIFLFGLVLTLIVRFVYKNYISKRLNNTWLKISISIVLVFLLYIPLMFAVSEGYSMVINTLFGNYKIVGCKILNSKKCKQRFDCKIQVMHINPGPNQEWCENRRHVYDNNKGYSPQFFDL